MEERPGQPEALRIVPSPAVGPIAQDRMAHRGQVDPDLVGPPRRGSGLQEGGPIEPVADLEERLGLLPGHRPYPDPRPHPPQGGLHREPVVRHDPPDECQVAAVHLVPPEHCRQRKVGLIGGGHDQQARGPGVETVHDAGTKRPPGRGQREPHPDEAVDQRPGEPARRWVGWQAGRLAHDQQGGIAIPDLDGRAFGRHVAHPGQVHGHPLAARKAMRLRPKRAVHPDPTAGDGPLRVGPGQGESVGDHGVQPARRRLELLGHLTPPAPGGCLPRRARGRRSRWPSRPG